MQQTSLSNYLTFFKIISELEDQKNIRPEEKYLLKQKFAIQEQSLIQLLQDGNPQLRVRSDYSKVKANIVEYIAANQNNLPHLKPRKQNRHEPISPCKNGNLIEQAYKQIETLSKTLKCILHTQDQPPDLQIKLTQLQDIIKQVNEKCQSFDICMEDELKKIEIAERLQSTYRQLKSRYSKYMNQLLCLMDEKISEKNIFTFIDSILKQMLSCDQYSFITIKDLKLTVYKSKHDIFQEFDLDQALIEQLFSIESNTIQYFENLLLDQYYQEEFQQYKNYIIKIDDYLYFTLHSTSNFIEQIANLSKIYNFGSNLADFAQFIIHTVQKTKVQFFSTIQISDMVLESGLELVRCSKYLLIEQIMAILGEVYFIEKITYENRKDSQSPKEAGLILTFKDSQFIQFQLIKQQNSDNYRIFLTAQNLYLRYQQFIKQSYERLVFYKFFIRSKTLYMIDFDKQGQLKFMSRPLSLRIKNHYNIIYDTNNAQSYKDIFKDNLSMLQSIQDHIQNNKKFQISDFENENYEIFMKKEETKFKGFSVIIPEPEQLRRKTQNLTGDIKKTMRQQLLQSETQEYIKKVEEFYPDIRNSVVAMYFPTKEQDQTPLQSTLKTPTLVFRRIDKEKAVGQKSFFFQQREEEKKQIKQNINPNILNETHFAEKETDSIIDQYDFNVINAPNQIEKSRFVWSILERNGFIKTFAIPLDKLCSFLTELEAQYNQYGNPFHNYDHGVQVMQSSHFIIRQVIASQGQNILNAQSRFCLVLSALCHDVAHTGKTNQFEAQSLSKLAILYHDKVILEQHHAATAIRILREQKHNILCNFPDTDFRSFRKGMIQNILSTDMQEHFKMLKEFDSRQQQFGQDNEDTTLLCGVITHTADFNGSTRKWPISRIWSERINKEYQAQYEEEGKRGYPQQPFMKDLDNLKVMSKNEMGFFKVIVRPLYASLNTFLKGHLQICVDNLDESIMEWDKIFQQQQQLEQGQQQ